MGAKICRAERALRNQGRRAFTPWPRGIATAALSSASRSLGAQQSADCGAGDRCSGERVAQSRPLRSVPHGERAAGRLPAPSSGLAGLAYASGEGRLPVRISLFAH